MNLQNIFNELEKIDGDVYDRVAHVSRRHMFSLFSRKAAAVAAPAVALSAVTEAYAQNDVVTDVLNFALLLEYLEADFYNAGLAQPGYLTGTPRTVFAQIAKHENAHVTFLKQALGNRAIPKPAFDFSARGQYATWLTNYNVFLALAVAFEDTGVRAYKGQAPNLISNDAVLTAALQIHSVEARHAARVRQMAGLKGWISGTQGPVPAVYAGEDNTNQLGVNALVDGITFEQATEAYDEPLSREQVTAIVTPFILRMVA